MISNNNSYLTVPMSTKRIGKKNKRVRHNSKSLNTDGFLLKKKILSRMNYIPISSLQMCMPGVVRVVRKKGYIILSLPEYL